MKASLNLIKKFVNLENITPQEVVDKLTYAGLEVEGLEKVASGTNLVIGQIIECENHPSSDHLHVLKVNLGDKYGVEQIVCGAPNARLGLKVIVARVGAELSKIGLTISKGVIRGVESNGMCCSLTELGVDKNYLSEKQVSGIEELPEDAEVGNENVLEYLLLDDYILDINVLANRSDCLAIFSLAKELGALFNREVNIPELTNFEELDSNITCTSLTEDCPQFSLKLVEGIKVKPSPKWLQSYLISHGIRSINNIVDIGNYIMILTGQPIHMYDLDKLSSNEFIVRSDYEGEFVALDEKTYNITKDDICIFNGSDIGCLGGVMGALSCTVDENSTRIVVEAANFKGSTIRKTTVKTGLSSDSSAHFIKGINPYQDQFVLNLTASLMVSLCEAKKIYKTVRYTTLSEERTKINCSYSYINKRLGDVFSKDEVDGVLTSLGIKIEKIDEDNFIALPPDHRIDLKVNADLSEEVFRFIGLNRIKPKLPEMVTTVGGLDPFQRKKRQIRDHLINNGINEVLTYTLVSPELNNKFVLLNQDSTIEIMNPMTVEHSLVRRGLVSSLLEVLKYNIAHQNKDVAIFEISDITTAKQSYQELCLILSGEKVIQGSLKKENYSYYDIKGLFDSLMMLLGIDEKRYKLERLTDSKYYHPGRSVKVMLGKEVVGVFGQIHPLFNKEYNESFILDLKISKFIEMKTSQTKMQQISKFPSRERDYAFVCKREVLADEFIRAIKKESRGIISSVNIFDIYEGEFLPEGYKSIAVKITFSSLESTLSDEQINVVEQAVLSSLNRVFGAYLRS